MNLEISSTAQKELLTCCVDVLTVLDESGTIQYESPSLGRVLGYDPEELVGEDVFEYVHPDDREAARETFQETVRESTGHTTGRVELRFRHENGEWVWIESRGTNQRGSAIGGYVIASRDITDRKEYERQLERERDRLEEFVSAVSHDLRNPLRVAEGRIALAQEECESTHLDAVAESHDRMDQLIEELLTLAREGHRDPQLTGVDLGETVESCWRNVETAAATLSVRTDRAVLADERQLQQLLENLIRNAVEHGGRAVTVTVGPLADGFYVEDDGAGLPDTDPEILLESGVSTVCRGTGLGLYIVRETVENHGWDLTVTGGDDGGARFEIRGVEVR